MVDKKDTFDKSWEAPLSQLITYRMSRFNAKISAQATKILKKNSKLSLMQWRVLTTIHGIEKPTHSKIAATTGFDGGQLSRCIHQMIDTGLLKAKTHESDSRQQYLIVTPTGQNMYEAARPQMRSRQADFVQALSEDEKETLFHILDKLERVADGLSAKVKEPLP